MGALGAGMTAASVAMAHVESAKMLKMQRDMFSWQCRDVPPSGPGAQSTTQLTDLHPIGDHKLDGTMAEHGWPVTFSIGLGIFASVPESEDEIISFCDKLMYQVKSSGKNNVLAEVFAASGTS